MDELYICCALNESFTLFLNKYIFFLQIQTFMIQLGVRPVEVSAAGFFIIDKCQIPSVSP
jgi:hypothetical protein